QTRPDSGGGRRAVGAHAGFINKTTLKQSPRQLRPGHSHSEDPIRHPGYCYQGGAQWISHYCKTILPSPLPNAFAALSGGNLSATPSVSAATGSTTSPNWSDVFQAVPRDSRPRSRGTITPARNRAS